MVVAVEPPVPAAIVAPGPGVQTSESDRGRVPIEQLIQTEIERRLRRKSWNQLDVCFKWRLVAAFLAESGYQDVPGLADLLRTRIRRNELTADIVDYDNETRRVVGLDMTALEAAPGADA